ncbi:MAG: membrane protein insertase YidC [Gemmatimonadetes bacterium]|nr:membrane protein insertase YidC [Gemmatimonadota bacterium]
MKTEIRFLLAVVLMIGVLVITNLMFPPVPPEERPGYVPPDSAQVLEGAPEAGTPGDPSVPPDLPSEGLEVQDPLAGVLGQGEPEVPGASEEAGATVTVEGPLVDFTFSTVGARLVSARLPGFPSFTTDGPVQLIHPHGAALGTTVLTQSDTADLSGLNFLVEPADGLRLTEGGGPRDLSFVYQHTTEPFRYEVIYTFRPDGYVIEVTNRLTGLDVDWVLTELGHGIPFNEQKDRDEVRAAAYVINHQQQGIRSVLLSRVDTLDIEEGPLLWTAFKSKYFLLALLAGEDEAEEAYLGGAVVRPTMAENQASVAVSQAVTRDGSVRYRLYLGPQEFSRLEALGSDMQNANPYGWKFMRPIVRPFAGIIIKILGFLHDKLNIGYGWVLILFGVMMRIVLFPLNQKGMKAQMRNMAAQPLMQEIQTKYKDNPEKLQKEMMKLYKEHGFNPLAGCLPMLLPWPVLIALFFVFQNTIELRGVSFLWLPDLSAPDPYFILPVFLGISMFLLQWVSMRSMPQQNPQMKMMMYLMPIMMVVIFFQLASGLNLYYATANIATLPQQIYIANERKKASAGPPLTMSDAGT